MSIFRKINKIIEKKFAYTGIEEIISHGILLILITLLLVFVLNLTNIINLSILYEVALSIIIFFVLVFLWLLAKVILHRKSLNELFKIEKTPLREYACQELKRIADLSEDIISEGVNMNQENVNMLTEALFKSGEGTYFGIEGNLPSEYIKKYPKYLAYHENYINERNEKEIELGERILIAKDKVDIYNDSIINTLAYANFINWHKVHNVKLNYIDRSEAQELSKKYELSTTDVGLWKGSFAVFFSQDNGNNSTIINMAIKGTPLFDKAVKYISDIINESKELKLEISIMPKELVEKWDGYVGCNERTEKFGNFLFDKLAEYKGYKGRILDAAPGIGCEAMFLIKNEFDVFLNEADPGFNQILKEKMSNVSRRPEIYSIDWRRLNENLDPVYSAVLLIGNSLCMVRGRESRKKCIEEFYKILIPGGKLIIDERNFSLIMRLKEKYRRKKIMYAGQVIDFRLKFEDGKKTIKFEFFKITKPGEKIGYIEVEALEKNEMNELLKEVGFENINKYSDFEEVFSEGADFYTYIATKPKIN